MTDKPEEIHMIEWLIGAIIVLVVISAFLEVFVP